MILSKETLDILYNFSTINQNIFINKGNVLKTKSIQKTIYAEATIPDAFPKDFAIYNLKQFLSVINTFNGCDITFKDDKMVIHSAGKYSVEYPYADPETVDSVKKDLVIKNPIIKLTLEEDDIAKINSLGSIFGLNMLTIEGNTSNKTTTVYYQDIKNNLTAKGSVNLFTEPEFDYKINISPENWKMMKGSYDITVSNEQIPMCKLEHTQMPIKYFIALHSSSEFHN
mgnify:CR=1 FL=1